MTSIHIYDPAGGPALPELPPLPIGVLAVGTAELLQQAADLPQPIYITVHQNQCISVQFAPEQASVQAVTRWAHRFGGIVTSRSHNDSPETVCSTGFDYYGITVDAYAYIPANKASI
jgi:hypothetical protein